MARVSFRVFRCGAGVAAIVLAFGCIGAISLARAQPPAPAVRAAELAAARAEVERREFGAALRRYEALLALSPDDADLLIEVARVHGFADHNAEAARLYRRVLAVAPHRRGDVLAPLAWQSLWAGEPEAAAAMFEELTATVALRADALDGLGQARQALGDFDGALAAYRAALAERPGDVRLQRRHALALLWLDRHQEAVAALEAMLARDPTDRDTAWALSNARNFSGWHRQALRDFARFGPPRSFGERFDVARAQAWAGYPERAWPLLQDATEAEAVWWRDWRLRRELTSYAYGEASFATDRDRLDTTALTAGAGWRRSSVEVIDFAVRRQWQRDPDASANGTFLQGLYRTRLRDDDAGTVWGTVLARVHDFSSWSPLSGLARALWVPDDGLRASGEVGREIVETPKAIAHRVYADFAAASIEKMPTPRLSAAGAMAAYRFDDGNRRLRLRARADYALSLRPRWLVGVEALSLADSKPTGPDRPARGYWSPDTYREVRMFTAVVYEQRPWDVYARVGIGRLREIDGFGASTRGSPADVEVAVAADVSANLRLRLSVGGSGSGAGLGSGGAGYWRRFALLTVNGWF